MREAVEALPTLAAPDFSKPFVLETEASSKGLGAVLSQAGLPKAFLSQGFSERAQKKSVYEPDLMAVVWAVQKWRHYLPGQHYTILTDQHQHFILLTDQRSLKFLTKQRELDEGQFKWDSKLIGLDFDIQ